MRGAKAVDGDVSTGQKIEKWEYFEIYLEFYFVTNHFFIGYPFDPNAV